MALWLRQAAALTCIGSTRQINLALLYIKLCRTFVSVLAELEQKTALLPAVLQTSNCIALVDHLTSVFKDSDWSSAARQA